MTLAEVLRFVRDCSSEDRSSILHVCVDRELEVARAAWSSATDQRKAWIAAHGARVSRAREQLSMLLPDLRRAVRP